MQLLRLNAISMRSNHSEIAPNDPTQRWSLIIEAHPSSNLK